MSVAGFAGVGASDGGGTGLASHAAQMGFARGAQMQQQQLHQAHDGRLALETKAGAAKTRIRDVWKHNLAHEMAVLRQLVDKYPYISMVSGQHHFQTLTTVVLIAVLGYRVPRDCCATDWVIHKQSRLPLPDSPMQRRPPQNDPTGNYALQLRRRGAARYRRRLQRTTF
jgi:hypothetical protein